MSIKRLLKNISDTTKFILNRDNAILVFESNNEKECLFFENIKDEDLDKLEKFTNVDKLKFVGSQEIYDLIIKKQKEWPSFEKKIFIEQLTEAVFYAESGNVRFQKKGTVSSKKKVLVVDDSKTIQKLLSRIITSSKKLEVLAVADSPKAAREIIEKERPDLITLDIHMPEMNGVDFLKTYLGAKHIPTVMISSVSMNEGPLVMEALSCGAHTYIQKPSVDELDEVTPEILERLESIVEIKQKIQKEVFPSQEKRVQTSLKFDCLEGLIVIGSSTGGTQALQHIFTRFPSSIPAMVVVQHIPAVFSKALADRLDSLCPFTVKEAEDGEFLQKNTIYIAPGDKQLKILKRGKEKRIEVNDDPPLNRFRPSVDYMFTEIPSLDEKKLLGVILTGMGKDRAKGLLDIRESGGFTIAQDEESSIVFGMPKEAIHLGAAKKIVSLDKMADEIILEFNRKNNEVENG